MKLLRVGLVGEEKPAALLPEGSVVDISSVVGDIGPQLLGVNALRELGDFLEIHGTDLPVLELAGLRIGPPITGIGKIVCVGLNYAEHARESGQAPPSEPVLFMKAPYTVVGPNDDVLIPPHSAKCDYEVELAIVVGKTARYLSDDEDPLEFVSGYCISNDVSEREFQLERGGQWDKGKNCETFNPLGPWFVTADEIGDPQALALSLRVNGEVRQQSSTADMIFGVSTLIRYVSQFMTLLPGDIINTGTPSGVGAGWNPPRFLRPGDEIEVVIESLGSQVSRCRRAEVR